MRKKKREMAAVFLSVMMMALTACGNGSSDVQEAVAPVENVVEETEDEAVVEEEGEKEPEKEEAEEAEEERIQLSYAEEHGLEFCKDTVVTVQGILTEAENEEDIEQIDAEWVLKSIEVLEAEDGLQTITVRHECTGYLWTDHKTRFLFNISLPSAGYFDMYTGRAFPTVSMSEGGKIGNQIEVEWGGQTYEVGYTQESEWNDGTEWTPDGKGGYTLPSTLCIMDTIVVTEGYEGLGMIVYPLTIEDAGNKSYGVNDEEEFFIEEVLEQNEGSVIFDVMDICAILEGGAETSDVGSESSKDSAGINTENPKENAATNNGTSAGNTVSKQEDTKTHTHDYVGSVTKNPTCTETGIKTYTCSCGDSFAEEIGKTEHQWVSVTETVYHPATGHYETVTETTYSCMNMNVCGYYRYGTWEEFEAHCKASEEAWDEAHVDFEWDGSSKQVFDELSTLCTTDGFIQRKDTKEAWIVDSDAWEETVTVTKCGVCGVQG